MDEMDILVHFTRIIPFKLVYALGFIIIVSSINAISYSVNLNRNMQPWKILIDGSELPKISSDDVLEVYHLRSAPLPIIQTSVGAFTMQSAGIHLCL
jgi:hypothetical protein